MKSFKLSIILLIFLSGISPVNETKAQGVSVNISMFRNELSPYGRWIDNPRYGQVWTYNDPGFRPYYSNGHWEYTNYGWAWVSDFDWGWAPFHYGRWEYDPFDGWMWIPGYEWASAWVSWSSYDGYYGWAPLGYGVNVNVSFGDIPYDRWTFIPRRNICDHDLNRYYMSPNRNFGFRNAIVINNYYEDRNRHDRFNRGPERNEAERYTSNRIQERRIDDRERQGYHNYGVNRARNDNDRPQMNNNQYGTGDANPRTRDHYNRNDIPAGNNNPVRIPADGNQGPNREWNNGARKNENRMPGNRQDDIPSRRNNEQPVYTPVRPQQIERPQRERPVQPVQEQRNSIRRDDNRNTPHGQFNDNNNPGQGRGKRGN